MSEIVKKIDNFFRKDIWSLDLRSLSNFKYQIIKTLRLISFTIREIHGNELTLRATSLVYITLLSIVPLIAFSFSILKAFGVVDTNLEPLLIKFLTPLGEKGIEISQKIMEFVDNMKVGVLGSIGLLALIWTVFSLIKKIDDSLNRIWNVTSGRSLVRRFSNYISLTLIGPVLMFVILGLTASLASNTIVQKLVAIEPLGTLLVIWGRLLPYIIIILVFTFIYMIVPNTKVNFKSALLGGFIAGISWQAVGTLFALSVASSTKYTAVYSSFAVLILFMLWLYINWLILLLGAQLSYCHQNLDFFGLKIDISNISSKLKEQLTLLIMYLVGHNYYHGKENLTLNNIVEYTHMPYDSIVKSLKNLEKNNLLIETADEPPKYLPAKDIELITLKDIISSARTNNQSEIIISKSKTYSEVNSLMDKIDGSIYDTLGNKTLRDIVSSN